jgi:hypothetical protein
VARILILLFGCFIWFASWPSKSTAQDLGPTTDISNLKAQFEKRVLERVQLGLDPILGKDQYALTLQVDAQVPTAPGASLFFPKLGASVPTSIFEAPRFLRFEDWVKKISLGIAYSEPTASLSDSDIKEKAAGILKSFGSYQFEVETSRFETRSASKEFPFTAAVILLSALVVGFSIYRTGKLMEGRANSAGPQPFVSPAPPKDDSSQNVAGTKEDSVSEQTSFSSLGATRWSELVKHNLQTAKDFVERLGRTQPKGTAELLKYMFEVLDLPSTQKLLPLLEGEVKELVRQSAGVDLSDSIARQADHELLRMITSFFIDENMDSDNVLKLIHDFDLNECAMALKSEPSVFSLYIKYFASAHLEQVIQKIPKEVFERALEHIGNAQPLDLSALAQTARSIVIQSRESKKSEKSPTHSKILTVVPLLDTSKEAVVYENLRKNRQTRDILAAGIEQFPQFLIPRLPGDLLKTVLNSFGLQERAKIIYSFEPEFKDKLVQTYKDEIKTSEALKIEFEMIEKDQLTQMQVLEKQGDRQREYYSRVRKYIVASPRHILVANEVLRDWMDEGAGHATQKAS